MDLLNLKQAIKELKHDGDDGQVNNLVALIHRTGRQLWSAVLISAMHTQTGKDMFDDMQDVKNGDLVIEISESKFCRKDCPVSEIAQAVGILEHRGGWGEWQIRLLSTGQFKNWHNADFIKIPIHI